ncbi:MAG: cobalt-precorrin-5B (C(1))-methyltransferase CbiD [Desulfovibrio sp.]|jgi:cobalt-precorrin-5B (C1)-methyltransferase|nr:cobalt-precorrin-5B (C(1))-methyltransferase CbiD [Desulfovibrio sp.]
MSGRTVSTGLREGFTTGTAAAGAALAALTLLCEGRAPKRVEVALPPFLPSSSLGDASGAGTHAVPVAACGAGAAPELGGGAAAAARLAHAAIRKDGGDDPDVTNGALITATVIADRADTFLDLADEGFVRVRGGPGVGRVTLPGLPRPVGEAAINPVPLAQIRHTLVRYAARLARRGVRCPPVTVVVSVPEGEKLASRTLNPRLGIVGGISILGTHGTTRPFSHEAWRDTVKSALSVALSVNPGTVCLSTGRRSEALLMKRYPALAPQNFIQVADFVEFSLSSAGSLPFGRIVWGCFFGKLLKLAQGMPSTHANAGRLKFTNLARLCGKMGKAFAGSIGGCVTAAQALDMLLTRPDGMAVIEEVVAEAAGAASRFAGRAVALHLFHTDGRELCAL